MNDNRPARSRPEPATAAPLQWACMACQFHDASPLCRSSDGVHSFEHLAHAYLDARDDASGHRHQAHDCLDEMIRAAPKQAAGFLVVACANAASIADLCLIAAGPLENLLEAHGPLVIDEFERIAKADPRFRLMLSGTWARDRVDAKVWARLVAAVSPGPVIDADARTPAAGLTDKIASKATLAALFSLNAKR